MDGESELEAAFAKTLFVARRTRRLSWQPNLPTPARFWSLNTCMESFKLQKEGIARTRLPTRCSLAEKYQANEAHDSDSNRLRYTDKFCMRGWRQRRQHVYVSCALFSCRKNSIPRKPE